jgi:hypothetical protein
MSTVSGLTSNSVTANTSTTQARRASDADADGDGRVHHGHHGHAPGGGGMARQVLAALQSLGLNVPQAGKSDKSANQGATTAAGTEDGGSTTDSSQASTLRHDMHEFMHQLFAAARGADDSGGNGIGYGKGGRPGFGQGLATLISQVSAGNVPAGLQSAFDKLTADLGAGSSSGTSSGSSTGSSGSSASGTSVTLQALLTQLQGNLGYATDTTTAAAGSTTTAASGNVVNAVA